MGRSRKLPVNRSGKVPITSHGKKYMLTYFVDGQKKRPTFDTRKEAEDEWIRLNQVKGKYGSQALRFDEELYEEATEAKRLVQGQDLRIIANFWLQAHAGLATAPKLGDAIDAFLETKDEVNRSKRHVKTLTSHLLAFRADRETRELSSFSNIEIIDWLQALGLKPRTLWNYNETLSNFFNWCVRRQWLKVSPTDAIDESDLQPLLPKELR